MFCHKYYIYTLKPLQVGMGNVVFLSVSLFSNATVCAILWIWAQLFKTNAVINETYIFKRIMYPRNTHILAGKIFVVVVLLFYVHGKLLWSGRDGKLT